MNIYVKQYVIKTRLNSIRRTLSMNAGLVLLRRESW